MSKVKYVVGFGNKIRNLEYKFMYNHGLNFSKLSNCSSNEKIGTTKMILKCQNLIKEHELCTSFSPNNLKIPQPCLCY